MKLTIKAWRGMKLMSQSELAKAIGVTQVTISSWENGKTEPRPSDIKAMKQAMKLKATDHIIVGEE